MGLSNKSLQLRDVIFCLAMMIETRHEAQVALLGKKNANEIIHISIGSWNSASRHPARLATTPAARQITSATSAWPICHEAAT
jgi:hypothetical protein